MQRKTPTNRNLSSPAIPRWINGLSAGGARYDSATDKGAGALLYGVLSFSNSGELTNIQCWNVPPDGNVAPTTATNLLTLARGESYYSFDFNFTGTPANNSSTLNFGNAPITTGCDQSRLRHSAPPPPRDASARPPPGTPSPTAWETPCRPGTRSPSRALPETEPQPPTPTQWITPEQWRIFLPGWKPSLPAQPESTNGQLTLTDTVVGASQLAVSSITHANAGGATPLTDPTIAQIFGNQSSSFTVDPGNLLSRNGPHHHQLRKLFGNSVSKPEWIRQGQIAGHQRGQRGVYHRAIFQRPEHHPGPVGAGQFHEPARVAEYGRQQLRRHRRGGNRERSEPPGNHPSGPPANYSLEMSNVDIGREMVDVITTQRAFQANAKSLSTVDELYEKLIQMIR